jgi:hypothetical protein
MMYYCERGRMRTGARAQGKGGGRRQACGERVQGEGDWERARISSKGK